MVQQIDESQTDVRDAEREVPPVGPGIMVLSSLLQTLHMNRRAMMLLGDLGSATPEAQRPISGKGDLPAPLVDLAGKILDELRRRGESGEKGQCEICYLADNSSKQVVIRCVALPGGNGIESARIVFVLNDTNGHHVEPNSRPP